MFKQKTIAAIKNFAGDSDGYYCGEKGNSSFKWFYYQIKDDILPTQGWKVHISANISNAEAVLETAVAYLIPNHLNFKHACGMEDLVFLNSAKGGLAQVGKFITVYFKNDAEFIKHALNLAKIFPKLQFPFIVTDRQIKRGSPVFYRYGSILVQEFQNEMGVIESVIINGFGEREVDKRENRFSLPGGIKDIISSNDRGIIEYHNFENQLLNDTYVTISSISNTYKIETFLGLDIRNGKYVLVKTTKPNMEVEKNLFAEDLLKNEAKILSKGLGSNFPSLIDIFSLPESRLVMVSSFVEGINLYDFIRGNAIKGIYLSKRQLKKTFLSIIGALEVLHKHKVCHNDLKPNNIIIDESLNTCLIDFETSRDMAAGDNFSTNLKSRGYYSPNTKSDVQADYYSLGILLYFILTAYNPSDSPREYDLLERPVRYYTGMVNEKLEALIRKLCSGFYRDLSVVRRDFIFALGCKDKPFRIKSYSMRHVLTSYKLISTNICDWLFKYFKENNNEIFWESSHVFNSGGGRLDINIGSAGILLYLVNKLSSDRLLAAKYRQEFTKAIHYLKIQMPNNYNLSGLFVGESGRTLAVVVGEYLLGSFDRTYVEVKNDLILRNLPQSNDLFNGLAGVGFYFLVLYVLTRRLDYLTRAEELCDQVITNAVHMGNDIFWPDHLTDKNYLGFAHGIAGIGYVIASVYRYVKNPSYLKALDKIDRTLQKYSVKCGNRSLCINWPVETNEAIENNYWCNGASGVGLFYLEMFSLFQKNEHYNILVKCKNAVLYGSSFLNPTLCHGLSGSVNFLINYRQKIGDKLIANDIYRFSELLKMAAIMKDNCLLFPSESPLVITPDFWVGFTGTAYTFDRISDIDGSPDIISTEYYENLRSLYVSYIETL